MTFYKIIDVKNGKYVSVVAGAEAQVVYEPGRVAKAPERLLEKGYGLCVFDGLGFALQLVNNDSVVEIWEVEVGSRCWRPDVRMGWLSSIANGRLRPYKGHYKGYSDSHGWPPSTMMADQVTLVKKVWPDAEEAR